MRGSSRWTDVGVVAITVVLVAAVAGCESIAGGPAQRVKDLIPTVNCVDSTGPNSTSQEIAHSGLEVPTKNLLTGEIMTVREYNVRVLRFPTDLVEAAYADESAVYSNVADGADARFARAACGDVGYHKINDVLGVTAQFRSTRHAVRAIGRQVCADIAESKMSGDEYIEVHHTQPLNRDREDTFAAFDRQIEQYRQQARGIPDNPITNWTNALVEEFEKIRREDPQFFVRAAEGSERIAKAALSIQCPQLR